MTIPAFWAGSLSEAWIYVEVSARRRDDAKTLQAWLIASVANLAGAKPKVTVSSLLKEKRPSAEQPVLAAMLSSISKPRDGKPKKVGPPTADEAAAQLEAFNASMRARVKTAQATKGNADVGKSKP